MKTKRIFAIHLLNDYSGSPLVLRQALEVFKGDFEVHLYTCAPSGSGNLSGIPGVINHSIFYKWSPNKFVTLFFFLCYQFALFSRLLFKIRKHDTVYINTLLPFAAALAARCRGACVIYHIHEVSIKPPSLKSFLVKVAGSCGNKFIFVSQFVKQQFDFPEIKTSVVYNALPGAFVKEAISTVTPDRSYPFTVLMLCSLKAYKGVYQFFQVAAALPEIHFELVLNASEQDVNALQEETCVPDNCKVYAVQKDTSIFYKRAYVVVNLSLIDEWLETFGMTILEAMYYGLPVVVPPVGGVTELVNNGVEGIYADARDTQSVIDAIQRLYSDEVYYKKISLAAWFRAQHFSQALFRRKIKPLFNYADPGEVTLLAAEI